MILGSVNQLLNMSKGKSQFCMQVSILSTGQAAVFAQRAITIKLLLSWL